LATPIIDLGLYGVRPVSAEEFQTGTTISIALSRSSAATTPELLAQDTCGPNRQWKTVVTLNRVPALLACDPP
jgi:hypothetical protein